MSKDEIAVLGEGKPIGVLNVTGQTRLGGGEAPKKDRGESVVVSTAGKKSSHSELKSSWQEGKELGNIGGSPNTPDGTKSSHGEATETSRLSTGSAELVKSSLPSMALPLVLEEFGSTPSALGSWSRVHGTGLLKTVSSLSGVFETKMHGE